MARVVVLGAGIAGHTAALQLRRQLPREHQVTVVSPKPTFSWIPSIIRVGAGCTPGDVERARLARVVARPDLVSSAALEVLRAR